MEVMRAIHWQMLTHNITAQLSFIMSTWKQDIVMFSQISQNCTLGLHRGQKYLLLSSKNVAKVSLISYSNMHQKAPEYLSVDVEKVFFRGCMPLNPLKNGRNKGHTFGRNKGHTLTIVTNNITAENKFVLWALNKQKSLSQ